MEREQTVILAPGFGGSGSQPILRSLARLLSESGIIALSIELSRRGARPSKGYVNEIAALRGAWAEMRREHPGAVALAGRSFGGRICTFLAAAEPPSALAIISYPIRPPGRPRPQDEAALSAVTCPTLIVQGDRDKLGPLNVLQQIASANPRIELVVLPGVGHDLGHRELEAAILVAKWLVEVLP